MNEQSWLILICVFEWRNMNINMNSNNGFLKRKETHAHECLSLQRKLENPS